jgi:hypothetical protein
MRSEANLQELERGVEEAREKLASDLATLRSPETFSEFSGALKAEALEVKDDVIEKAKSTATSTMWRVADDLKAKAAANPGAALAIGAGLAWRLIHRPPIATALVGAGLFSLLRTRPAPSTPYMGLYDEDRDRVHTNSGQTDLFWQAAEMAGTVRDKVEQWSADASAAAQQTAETIKETTASVANAASRALNEAQQTASDVTSKTAAMASRASSAVQETVQDEEVRDKFLLGAAALAVAAAVGISFGRRGQ